MVKISTTEDAVIADVEIAAPVERVFSAITDPSQLAQWWGSEDKYVSDHWEMDLRVGGKWKTVGKSANGEKFSVEGEYLEIDPPRLLAQTWLATFHDAATTTVRWELTPVQGGTRLLVTHAGLGHNQPVKTMYSNGWPGVLGWLKGFAERNAPARA